MKKYIYFLFITIGLFLSIKSNAQEATSPSETPRNNIINIEGMISLRGANINYQRMLISHNKLKWLVNGGIGFSRAWYNNTPFVIMGSSLTIGKVNNFYTNASGMFGLKYSYTGLYPMVEVGYLRYAPSGFYFRVGIRKYFFYDLELGYYPDFPISIGVRF